MISTPIAATTTAEPDSVPVRTIRRNQQFDSVEEASAAIISYGEYNDIKFAEELKPAVWTRLKITVVCEHFEIEAAEAEDGSL